jgi:thiamine pyrophosphokinase
VETPHPLRSNVLLRQALIFANGDINDGPMTRQAIAEAQADTWVVAADGGARIAQHFGLRVGFVIGDMDSLSDTELQTLVDQGAKVQSYPEEKNETDLELALQWAAQQDVTWARVIDQTIANIYLLTLPALHGRDVRLVGGRQETWLLHPGEHVIKGAKGDTVSLIPIGGEVRGVRTENLYYPLKDETLAFGPARGISNVMNTDLARVWLQTGLLLVIHTIGRA